MLLIICICILSFAIGVVIAFFMAKRHLRREFEIYIQRAEVVSVKQEIENELIKERDRISQIIHDEIGNKLIALLYEFERNYQQKSFGMAGTEMLWHLIRQLKESIGDTRSLVREFSDSELNSSGIVTDLERFCKSKDGFQGVSISFAGKSGSKRFDFRKEKEIVSMTKELVYNSLKYGGCWHIDVALTWEEHLLTIEVSDDGYGLKTNDIKKYKQSGLSGMKDRTEAIGATLEVHQPQKGTRITISMKL